MKINQENSIISVYGVGNIKIQANIMRITYTFSYIAKTISDAQNEVNKMVDILLKRTNELCLNNIQTDKINFQPEYEWKNQKHILKGQKVEQRTIVTIDNLNDNLEKAKALIDKITIDIDSMNCTVYFGINNYEEKITEARNLAYSNALEKAKQYAKQANLNIIKAIKISEFEPRNDEDYEYGAADCCIAGSTESSTKLQISDIEIEKKLYCDFLAQ
ncbi:hypothetical protein R84B8_00989 [Treponema sp. R8-4-B8]